MKPLDRWDAPLWGTVVLAVILITLAFILVTLLGD